MSMQTNSRSCVKSDGASESGAEVPREWKTETATSLSQEWQGQCHSVVWEPSTQSRNFL